MDACREPLSANQLSYTQLPGNNGHQVTVTTLLMHSSGQWMRSIIGVTPAKTDSQALGSVLSYLRRYALSAMVGISQIDDDAEEAISEPERQSYTNMGGTVVDEDKCRTVADEAIRIVDEYDDSPNEGAKVAKEIYQPLNNDERQFVNGILRVRKFHNESTGRDVQYWSAFVKYLKAAA
jgi:hypothetical protein